MNEIIYAFYLVRGAIKATYKNWGKARRLISHCPVRYLLLQRISQSAFCAFLVEGKRNRKVKVRETVREGKRKKEKRGWGVREWRNRDRDCMLSMNFPSQMDTEKNS